MDSDPKKIDKLVTKLFKLFENEQAADANALGAIAIMAGIIISSMQSSGGQNRMREFIENVKHSYFVARKNKTQ